MCCARCGIVDQGWENDGDDDVGWLFRESWMQSRGWSTLAQACEYVLVGAGPTTINVFYICSGGRRFACHVYQSERGLDQDSPLEWEKRAAQDEVLLFWV